MPNKPLLTVREVAELLGVKPGRIYRMIDEGELPAYKLAGRLVRISRETVEEIMGKKIA